MKKLHLGVDLAPRAAAVPCARINEGTGRGLVVCDSPQFNACGCTARSSSVGGRWGLKPGDESGKYGPSDRNENLKPLSTPAGQRTKRRWMASCDHSTPRQGFHKAMGRNVIPSQALSEAEGCQFSKQKSAHPAVLVLQRFGN